MLCSRKIPLSRPAPSLGSARCSSSPSCSPNHCAKNAANELEELGTLLSRLDLRPADEATAELAAALGASYGLRAADAVHLATAVAGGAARFITNNRSDFPKTIGEVDITYPDDLPPR